MIFRDFDDQSSAHDNASVGLYVRDDASNLVTHSVNDFGSHGSVLLSRWSIIIEGPMSMACEERDVRGSGGRHIRSDFTYCIHCKSSVVI